MHALVIVPVNDDVRFERRHANDRNDLTAHRGGSRKLHKTENGFSQTLCVAICLRQAKGVHAISIDGSDVGSGRLGNT